MNMRVPFLKSFAGKLFVTTTVLVLLTVVGNTIQSSYMFNSYMQRRIEDNVVQNSREVANSVSQIMDTWVGYLAILVHNLVQAKKDDMPSLVDNFLSSNSEFVSFAAFTKKQDSLEPIIIRNRAALDDSRFNGRDATPLLDKVRLLVEDKIKSSKNQSSTILFDLSSAAAGLPIVGIATPFAIQVGGAKGGDSEEGVWAVLILWQTRLAKTLPTTGTTRATILSGAGQVIVSPREVTAASAQSVALVRRTISGKEPYGFQATPDPRGPLWLGGFAGIPKYGLHVVIESDGRESLSVAKWIAIRSFLWALLFLLVALAMSFIVSSGMTFNLRRVTAATDRIARGDFVTIQNIGRDEIGVLAVAVNSMSHKIALLMAQQVEKAHLDRELAMAAMLQHSFLPRRNEADVSNWLTVVTAYRPASQCCGDWHGHFPLSDTEHLIFIADATGHGVPAAMVTAIAFSGVSLLVANHDKISDPLKFLTDAFERLNNLMVLAGNGSLTMTMFGVHIDLANGSMTYMNAGHVFPLVVPTRVEGRDLPANFRAGKAYFPITARSNLMGILPGATFQGGKMQLQAQDKLVFFTDGLTDVADGAGRRWGNKGLDKVIKNNVTMDAAALKEQILSACYAHLAERSIPDDITLLVLEVLNAGHSVAEAEDPGRSDMILELAIG